VYEDKRDDLKSIMNETLAIYYPNLESLLIDEVTKAKQDIFSKIDKEIVKVYGILQNTLKSLQGQLATTTTGSE
jgi:hypothetical protein